MMEFKPGQYKYRCKACDDLIWSRYEGEYVACKCGKSAIDQTAYYTRGLGSVRLEPEENNLDENCISK